MRLNGESQVITKERTIEDYSLFNSILKSKKINILMIAYIAVAVASAVCEIISGGIILGIIDVLIHGFIVFGLIQFNKSNKTIEDKYDVKGIKKMQIANIIKYSIIFILLVILIVMFVLNWSTVRAAAAKHYTNVKDSIYEDERNDAKAALKAIFPAYFPVFLHMLVVFFGVTVYYGSVMRVLDCTIKYQENGTHFWKELKFAGIFLFVCAGLVIYFAVGLGLNLFDSMLSIAAKIDIKSFIGGTGILSMIPRILNALIFAFMGFVFLTSANKLSKTETASVEQYEVEVDAE